MLVKVKDSDLDIYRRSLWSRGIKKSSSFSNLASYQKILRFLEEKERNEKKEKKKKECLDDIGKISCYKKIYARLLEESGMLKMVFQLF